MIKQILLTGLLLSVIVPAQAKSGKEKPAWIDNPYTVCAKTELCAVGIGSGINSAKADARSGLAKIFETKIKSSFEYIQDQYGDDSVLKVKDYISESSDVPLNAVEIKEIFETPTDIYALAALNKPVAARITQEEIDDLDQKMKALLQEDSPAAAVRLEKLYEQRRGLNQRHIVLTGSPVIEKITYEQVYGNKKARIGKRHIFLSIAGKPDKAFDQTVRDVLKENGYTFADESDGQTPRVTVSLQPEKQYSNIDGFVKYAYHFTMKAPDKKGKTIDVLATTLTETGRNEKQAFSNALESLKAYLNENVLNLNF